MLSRKSQSLPTTVRLPPIEALLPLPLFTLLSLALVVVVWGRGDAEVLHAAWVLYLGIGLIAVSALATTAGLLRYTQRYDLLLSGSLLTWLIAWQKQYLLSAPIFQFYPIFFLGITLLVNRFIIHQRGRFSPDQMQLMRMLQDAPLFRPRLLKAAVVASLFFPGHYLLYLIAVSFLVIQYGFAICLERPIGFRR